MLEAEANAELIRVAENERKLREQRAHIVMLGGALAFAVCGTLAWVFFFPESLDERLLTRIAIVLVGIAVTAYKVTRSLDK